VWVADYVLGSLWHWSCDGCAGAWWEGFWFCHKIQIIKLKLIAAKKSQIPNPKSQINSKSEIQNSKQTSSGFVDDGVLINSGKYDGLTSSKAREEMTKWLEEKKIARRGKFIKCEIGFSRQSIGENRSDNSWRRVQKKKWKHPQAYYF